MTSLCCKDLSSTLSSNQSLIKISLTLNTLEREGIMKLSEVMRSTECKLQVLGLCKEALDEEAQKLLEAVASSNLRLAVKQDCNDHEEEDGVESMYAHWILGALCLLPSGLVSDL